MLVDRRLRLSSSGLREQPWIKGLTIGQTMSTDWTYHLALGRCYCKTHARFVYKGESSYWFQRRSQKFERGRVISERALARVRYNFWPHPQFWCDSSVQVTSRRRGDLECQVWCSFDVLGSWKDVFKYKAVLIYMSTTYTECSSLGSEGAGIPD